MRNIIICFLIFLYQPLVSNISFSQTKGKNIGKILSGRYLGSIGSDNNSIELNILIKGDSVFGNCVINWKSNLGLVPSIIYGKIYGDQLNLNQRAGTQEYIGLFQLTYNFKSEEIVSLNGLLYNTQNSSFQCSLNKADTSLLRSQNPLQNPFALIFKLIKYSNGFAINQFSALDSVKNQWEDSLKFVYNSFFSPQKKFGEFINFKNEFLTTLGDTITDTDIAENTPDAELFSSVTAIHTVRDYILNSDSIKISKCRNDYILIPFNGEWKIIYYSSKVLSSRTSKKDSLQFPDKLLSLNSSIKINNVAPNPVDIGDTILINYSQLNRFNRGIPFVYVDNKSVKSIIDNDNQNQVSVIIPDGRYDSISSLYIVINKDTSTTFRGLIILKNNNTNSKNSNAKWYWAGSILLLLLLLFIIYRLKTNRKKSDYQHHQAITELEFSLNKSNLEKRSYENVDYIDQIPTEINIPYVPEDLENACNDGKCVLFVGTEISKMAGFPDREEFLLKLLEEIYIEEIISEREKYNLDSLIAKNKIEEVYDSVIIKLKNSKFEISDFCRQNYSEEKNLPEIFNLIKETSFQFIVTSCLDNSLEKAFGYSIPTYFGYDDIDELKEAFLEKKKFILKLFGNVDDPIFTASQLNEKLLKNEQLRMFVQNIFVRRTALSIGASLEEVQRFMSHISISNQNLSVSEEDDLKNKLHYSLVRVRSRDWEILADNLEHNYSIKVLPFTKSDFTIETDFMRKLAEKAPYKTDTNVIEKKELAFIEKISIENVGPFEKKLELELDRNWNILLGDNGVGKSTILKAVASVICGYPAGPYAHKLLHISKNDPNKRNDAKIILDIGGESYTTKISYNAFEIKADISSDPELRELFENKVLSFAFPPLRAISSFRDSKQKEYIEQTKPVALDTLPLVIGDPDFRMNDLKTWLIDTKSRSTELETGTSNKVNNKKKLLDNFFEVIRNLTPESLIVKNNEDEIYQINTADGTVKINTEDGLIPIEYLSQGTLSLISWVGILVQRLNNVFPDSENPLHECAIVLMDEIDAHMHPEWQRTIISQLKKAFPNIQFIVSTHSPLVVGGMDPKQIFKFKRNEERIVIREEVDYEDTVGKVDQLLRSNLFGLNSTLSLTEDTERIKKEYQDLLGKENKSESELLRLRELEKKVRNLYPATGEDINLRKSQKLLQDLLEIQLTDESVKNKIQENAKRLFKSTKNKNKI